MLGKVVVGLVIKRGHSYKMVGEVGNVRKGCSWSGYKKGK